LLSSEPGTVEINGWTNPIILVAYPLAPVTWAGRGSAVIQAGP